MQCATALCPGIAAGAAPRHQVEQRKRSVRAHQPRLTVHRQGSSSRSKRLETAAALGSDLEAASNDLWPQASVEHPFIVAVREGTVEPEQFNAWLLQVRWCHPCDYRSLRAPQPKLALAE